MRIGDMAMVIKPSACGHACGLGKVFTVTRVTDVAPYECAYCDRAGGWSAGVEDEQGNWYSMPRVMKIEPPSDEEVMREMILEAQSAISGEPK